MSPEQLRAKEVDARADVWGVGVVLYELLADEVPFDGDDMPELVTAILTMPPIPLRRWCRPCPTGFARHRDVRRQGSGRPLRQHRRLAQELRPFAPQSSHARIDHIAEITREKGTFVRPPTEDSMRLSLPGADRMSSGGVASGSGVHRMPASRSSWRNGLLAFAAVAVLGAVAFGVVQARGPSAAGSSVTAAPSSTPVVPASAAAPSAATRPEALASSAPVASAAPSSSAAGSPTVKPRAGKPSSGRPAASAKPKPSDRDW